MTTPRINTLVIPPHTRLLSVERIRSLDYAHLQYDYSWALWMHTNATELQKRHEDRQGTYLLLNADGTIDRVTVDGLDERTLRVME